MSKSTIGSSDKCGARRHDMSEGEGWLGRSLRDFSLQRLLDMGPVLAGGEVPDFQDAGQWSSLKRIEFEIVGRTRVPDGFRASD